jgi:hypothetical protein
MRLALKEEEEAEDQVFQWRKQSRSTIMPKYISKPITEGLDSASTQFCGFAA